MILLSKISHNQFVFVIALLSSFFSLYLFCEFTENRFLRFLTLSASNTIKVATLIIANFNFATEAKRQKNAKIKLTQSFPNELYILLLTKQCHGF